MKTPGKNTRSWAGRGVAAVAALTALSLAVSGCVGGGEKSSVEVPSLGEGALPEATVAQMNDATTAAMGAIGASGAIVGVWAPWSGSWVAGLGTVSTGSETAVTPDMGFRVATVTREMTCDALYGMVADGLVTLDAPVSDYVVGVSTLKDVTLEQLCDSTAGLWGIPARVKAKFTETPERVWRPRELASFGIGAGDLGEPGARHMSSDTGYLLLGLALENISGMSASAYIAKYVTEPLGLDNTELPPADAAAPTPAPALIGQTFPAVDGKYNCAAPTDVSVMSSSIGYTDSGATSTVTDLGVYARALAANALGSKDDGRFEPVLQYAQNSPGWETSAGGSRIVGDMVGLGGSVPGYTTAAYSDRQTGLTVVAVLNSSVQPNTATALVQQLSAIASKAPAAAGQTAPTAGLPWTPEIYAQAIANSASCAPLAAG